MGLQYAEWSGTAAGELVRIRREDYGGGEQTKKLLVTGLGEEELPVTVTVRPRAYTQEEAVQAFYGLMDGMEERIRGDNHSLMEVHTDLKLQTRDEETGILMRWRSSDPELISSAGRYQGPVEKAQELYLSVHLSAGSHEADFQIPVRVVPPEMTGQEAMEAALEEAIRRQDEEQKESEYLVLPGEQDGKSLIYRLEGETDYRMLPLMGLLAAALLIVREREQKKEQEKKRERELLLDYADLVSKLMVFIGAGMTVRGAWERIARDYEASKKKGRQSMRAASEEVCQTFHQLENGVPEGTAYREFGRRCRLQPYLKLSSLLEQNRKAGTKNLRAVLQTELEDAFEQRKNLARRMGEEAGTKLLLPLFLMLGMVMVMIMAPAMMSMG
ncbi:MAG: hypothetical protein Q4C73_01495 [Eubacteriales bacterium]|nr:hypothetical protein [Eubacteriales bacterium]